MLLKALKWWQLTFLCNFSPFNTTFNYCLSNKCWKIFKKMNPTLLKAQKIFDVYNRWSKFTNYLMTVTRKYTYLHRSGRRRSCLGGRSDQKGQLGRSPWFPVPDPPRSPSAHIYHLEHMQSVRSQGGGGKITRIPPLHWSKKVGPYYL